MSAFLHILGWTAAVLVLLFVAGWLGHKSGRRLARKYPSATMALWMLGNFLKFDPPPPPKAERVMKDEEAARDPPQT